MEKRIHIVGAGLAGSEAALQLAARGRRVVLHEMRPAQKTEVHKTGDCAELVCSNSLKGTREDSAPGMLKHELSMLGSCLYRIAQECSVPAGGALAVDRERFSQAVTAAIEDDGNIELERGEVRSLAELDDAAAIILATGPLTSMALSHEIEKLTGSDHLAFYDAAAPIVMADSLDMEKVFRQSRYEQAADQGLETGDYLNAPFTREEYDAFIDALLAADRVIARDFESKELFQACQPIEEIARAGHDAPRFGPLKPVGLTDPTTGRRPWAAVQLRAENKMGTSYNLVGFQTNLKFAEQERVFRMIPGLEHAEFARFGVMHRNTFVDAPRLLDRNLHVLPEFTEGLQAPVFIAGQLGGTEGYCEAIRSGLHTAIAATALLCGIKAPMLPVETAFGALLAYATDPNVKDYQPMHVNFGILPPLDPPVRNKRERYRAYAQRGAVALAAYVEELAAADLMTNG